LAETRLQAFRDDGGRLHLSVHRDAATGRRRLALDAALFDERWQDDVALSAAVTATEVLGDEPTLDRVLDLTRRAMAATSRLVDGFLAHAPVGSVACKAGCDHCCHVVVGVTAPEALVIVEQLKRSRSAPELARLMARIAAAHKRTRGLSSSERFRPEYPCVFIEGGRCSIYEARPLACRGMNSLDATECESRLRDPDARAEFAEKGGGHLFVEPIRAFRAVSGGLQLALLELYHLDMRPLDLTAAMHLLLQTRHSLADRWMAGQRPFESAVLDGQS
jgi:Fe-S-cluster containining protein